MIFATSTHPWNHNIRIKITDKKICWFKNDILIPDPQNVQDMIEYIDRLLMFVSCQFICMEQGTKEELIAVLYNKPLEYDIQLVYILVCGCNMGNCCTVRDIKFEEKVETYGDALKVIALGVDPDCYWKGKITYSTYQSLVDAFKKNNIEVDPEQIKKHMYSDDLEKIGLIPHHYEYPDSSILQMNLIQG